MTEVQGGQECYVDQMPLRKSKQVTLVNLYLLCQSMALDHFKAETDKN